MAEATDTPEDPIQQVQAEPETAEEASRPSSCILLPIILACVAYLLNPTLGVDLLPDNLPIVGNLDEATAVLILLRCLSYYGLDLTWLLAKPRKRPRLPPLKERDGSDEPKK